MFESTVIFQRTQAGRTEIHEKKCGLTQSERLVLIMVDGVSSFRGVRSKLPVLTDERFERAIRTLLRKDLILEVLMPIQGQAPEEVESTVVDRFLQQDPLDPVTIIMFEDDELLDWPEASKEQAAPSPPTPTVQFGSQPGDIDGHKLEPQRPLAEEDAPHVRDEEDGHAEADGEERMAPAEQQMPAYEQVQPDPKREPEPDSISAWAANEFERPALIKRAALADHSFLFYWGLTVVGAFVLGFALARLTG
jgi:hypothetical protein